MVGGGMGREGRMANDETGSKGADVFVLVLLSLHQSGRTARQCILAGRPAKSCSAFRKMAQSSFTASSASLNAASAWAT